MSVGQKELLKVVKYIVILILLLTERLIYLVLYENNKNNFVKSNEHNYYEKFKHCDSCLHYQAVSKILCFLRFVSLFAFMGVVLKIKYPKIMTNNHNMARENIIFIVFNMLIIINMV